MCAGMRIFKMLVEKKQLEQKQIADFAMVPVREAREVLYKMLKGGYLALQVCHITTVQRFSLAHKI